jgi:ADP-heptose:LPS heptosyltransferase
MLFFTLEGLGDSILNFPIFQRLKRDFQLEVVGFNNGTSQFYASFHQPVRAVQSKAELLRVASSLRADEAFFCYPIWKKEMATVLLSRVKHKRLLRPTTGLGARLLSKNYLPSEPSGHQIDNNFKLLEQIFGDLSWDFDPYAAFALPAPVRARRSLAVHPTASSVTKQYPLRFWQELLALLSADFEELQIYCGANDQEAHFCRSLIDSLHSAARNQAKLNVGLDFHRLLTSLSQADLFIGNDSSLMHMCAILDRPLVALWSFGDFRLSYPYANQAVVYMPHETFAAQQFEYPKAVPAFMARASAEQVARIARGANGAPDQMFTPRFRNQVPVYFY